MDAPNDTSTAAPRGRAQPQPPTRPVDRRLLARDRDLARPRARPGDGQRLLLRRLRAHQRVHGRDPDPEPRARARRGRGALRRVRPGVQRAAREGGAEARVARRLDALLADAARPRRPSPHSSSCSRRCSCGRSAIRAATTTSRSVSRASSSRSSSCSGSPGSSSGSSTRTTTSRVPALAPVAWNLVIVVGLVLGVPRIDDESAQLYLYAGVVVARDARAAPPADPVAAPPRRSADGGHRLARSGGQARARADAAGDADDRARQRELPRRHALRVAAARPRARAGRDRQGVPPLHAPAGRLRRGRHDGALPDARPARRARRHRRAAASARRRAAPDRLPARPGRARVDRARRADRAPRLPARRVHRRGHGDRRPVPAGVLDRARLQRLDADPEPQLLRGADELGADRHRARRGRPQRRVRHRLLPPRDLGHPACDVDRERRRGRPCCS